MIKFLLFSQFLFAHRSFFKPDLRTDISLMCVQTKLGALGRPHMVHELGFYRNGPGDHD